MASPAVKYDNCIVSHKQCTLWTVMPIGRLLDQSVEPQFLHLDQYQRSSVVRIAVSSL